MSYLDILWKLIKALLVIVWIVGSAGIGIGFGADIEEDGPDRKNVSGLVISIISFICSVAYVAYKLQ